MGEPFRPMDQAELRALEAQCIQECPPACTAACPIHVDVRGVLRDLGAGAEDAALAKLTRILPFPGIISRICEQPCRPACLRGQRGDPIEIARLERACVDAGVAAADAARRIPRRSERIAIIGAGLAGMTGAADLVRKGYAVTVFDRNGRVGGHLRTLSEDVLPTSVRSHDLAFLGGPQVTLRVSTEVAGTGIEPAPPAPSFESLVAGFDAVLVAAGAGSAAFGLAAGQGEIEADPITFATSRERVFVAGSGRRPGMAAIDAVADGRRAANSIDRFVQGVSLTASRDGEGSGETCLYTSLEGVEPAAAIPATGAAGAYTLAEARAEARRCISCECMECVKVCEYLGHFERYPRRAIREIYNNLSIVKGTRYANRMINGCSVCGLCAAVCPTDLDMGSVAIQSRRTMVLQERMPQSAHDFGLRDMAFSQGEAFALVRNAPGADASDALFFPGCQLAGSSPDAVEQVYAHLRAVVPGGRVGLMLGCCGAPATWAGQVEPAADAAARIRAALAETNASRVILACSSCIRSFRAALPDVTVESIWSVFDALGLPAEGAPGAGRRVAVHDACATRDDADLHDSIRAFSDGSATRWRSCREPASGRPAAGTGGCSGWRPPRSPARSSRRAPPRVISTTWRTVRCAATFSPGAGSRQRTCSTSCSARRSTSVRQRR